MASYPLLRPFIVHGHNIAFRDEVVDHMTNTLGMPDPMVLDGVASAGRTVIEKFEEESSKCNIAVVLLTPDDEGTTTAGLKYRTARPNVWIELGYFFGRRTGRTLLIYRAGLDIPTDISGVVYIDASAGMKNVNVAKRLETELNFVMASGIAGPAPTAARPGGRYDVSGTLQLISR